MRLTDLEPYLDKKIKITLDNGYSYSGEIVQLNDDNLIFRDKFGGQILIIYSSIRAVMDWTGHPGKYKLPGWNA